MQDRRRHQRGQRLWRLREAYDLFGRRLLVRFSCFSMTHLGSRAGAKVRACGRRWMVKRCSLRQGKGPASLCHERFRVTVDTHQSSYDSWSVQRVMSLAELVAVKYWLWRAERRHGWQGAFHLGDAMLVIAWPCFALHACAYCVTVWYGMDGIQRQV